MAIIPVKLDKKMVKLIDALVEMGIFRSRNEAIRSMIRDRTKSLFDMMFSSRVLSVVSELMRINNAIRITARKPAWKIIAEERERI